ncbi:BTAD domain-containing putative transcriptional regulator [Nonomuraea sp. MCN248]|uniref:BTAD domain-containing putative transcriptional regulator n=1 Tax=Nonomuraea corallina TaxID=2989783 RepID=A0ABT4S8Z4_9ACTN|nr:BTAD domain-containing putative transcriptional regulator [Nonomuraea corallina]MDA0633639.1 BTAD domain-containing putative transcriptional regulator [Nonomuraea corallina]
MSTGDAAGWGDVRVLGPLEVRVAGEALDLGGRRLRLLFALLTADAGRVVTVRALAEGLWGLDAPPDAHRTVRTYVSRMRKVLSPADRAEPQTALISTHPSGYVLRLEADGLDAARFERLTAEGRALVAEQPSIARERLSAALSLWRGDAYGEFAEVALLRQEATRLNQLRLRAVEDRIDAELAIGAGEALVGELLTLTERHPGHERLWGQLMIALCRGSRHAEALEMYVRARAALIEQSGMEPSPALAEIHRQVLSHDPRLLGARIGAPAVGIPRPAQLPPDVAGFTDRERELVSLDMVLAGAHPAGAVVCAVSGTAGVGKTTLAVHWARRVAERFPDGQLYVNLRGFDPAGSAVSPAQAVRGFLDALGVSPAGVPPSLEAQTGLYRSLLNDRRMLVVLDNARDAEQVRPLLPAAPGCMALITSRNRLASLAAVEGADLLVVDLLTAAQAGALLTYRLGAARVAAEPAAVSSIIERCAGLPLALAIIAGRAAAQPHLPLAALAHELEEIDGRLDTLNGGDPVSEIRAVFAGSCNALAETPARLFRLLGLHPERDVSLHAAASLVGLPPARVRALLAELVRVHLVNEIAPGRYSLHDLLRAYAAEQVATHEGDDARHAATRRMLDHYLHTADAAGSLLTRKQSLITLARAAPDTALALPGDHGQALTWFAAELPVLAAIVERPPQDFHPYAWQLAATLATFLDRQGHWLSLAVVQTAALRAAQRHGDQTAQANAHLGLGLSHVALDQDTAIGHFERALEIYERFGNHIGQAHTHQAFARALGAQQRHREALAHAYDSLKHYLAVDDRAGQSAALGGIGWYHAHLGDYAEALAHCRQALDLARQTLDLNGQAHNWDSIGYIRHQLGEHQRAVDCYRRALVLFRQTGDRQSMAIGLGYIGDAHRAAGDPAAAREAWSQALVIADELNLPESNPLRVRITRCLDRASLAERLPEP